jgi:hypothetical protein
MAYLDEPGRVLGFRELAWHPIRCQKADYAAMIERMGEPRPPNV